MYPLVIILGVGFLRSERVAAIYSLILAGIGWIIAFYHNLLYYNILPESAGPCMKGISCTTKFIEWLGFLTIPLLSLIAFSLVIIVLLFSLRNHHEK